MQDLRQMVNISDIQSFIQFVRLLAANVSHLLNLSSFSRDIGISVPTLKRWLSILESSYIVFLLHPYYRNLGKRIIKSPKIYFYRTSHGEEIDLIIERGSGISLVEIKASVTYRSGFQAALTKLDIKESKRYVVYQGEDSEKTGGVEAKNYKSFLLGIFSIFFIAIYFRMIFLV